MKIQAEKLFPELRRTAAGHFVLHFYAAIYNLINFARRLRESGGGRLEELFERYPYLAEYFTEMRKHMPPDLTWSQAAAWWEQAITAWEEDIPDPLPIRALARESGFNFANRLALFVAGLVEEDSRFGTLMAELQEPLSFRRPTLETAGQILVERPAGQSDVWRVCRPLLTAGVLEAPEQNAPRSEWLLRVPPVLWDAAKGLMDERPTAWSRYLQPNALPAVDELIYPDEWLRQFSSFRNLVDTGRARTLIIRNCNTADTAELAGAVARCFGRGLIRAEGAALLKAEGMPLLGSLCSMSTSLPALNFDLAPGERINIPRMSGYKGPVVITLGSEGGIEGDLVENSVTMTLPLLRASLRERCWTRAFGDMTVEDLPELSRQFLLSGGHIRRVAHIAAAHAILDSRQSLTLDDVRKAGRSLNHQMLDNLADHMEATGSWSDLVATRITSDKLKELQLRCTYRESVLERLGPAFANGVNRGVRGLMTGASGTGKTLAAKILAAELGMDLYRVDLAAVVNKYIGETEKNLHKVLSRAEALDVVLLLDEGDALLGNRTEVKSANDRYANLETNYLLQRLETYQGILLVTTNLGENIDPAFARRMDVVVPFFRPRAEERWRIMNLHMPHDHRVDDGYMELVAHRCELTGGQIRNTAMLACFLAMEEGAPMDRPHLEQALRSEYRKAGATFPLDEEGRCRRTQDGGMEAFIAALGNGQRR